jgi:hypothetical protein
MSKTFSRAWRYAPGLATVLIVLGCVAEANAYPQRRGRMYIPQPPANVDSSAMIDALNKPLKTLSAIDYRFGGHREKAIEHIQAAIRDLQVPNAQGKTASATVKASAPASASPPATKTATVTATPPPADAVANLQKVKEDLFAVYHKLNDKSSTRGRIHAGAQVLTAIQEVTSALNTVQPAGTPAAKPAAPRATPASPLQRYMIK